MNWSISRSWLGQTMILSNCQIFGRRQENSHREETFALQIQMETNEEGREKRYRGRRKNRQHNSGSEWTQNESSFEHPSGKKSPRHSNTSPCKDGSHCSKK